MKRIPRQPERFQVLDLFAAIAPAHGLSLNDATTCDRFLKIVRHSFEANAKNPIILHGTRVQAMFAFVAASLGRAILVKEEDSGKIYATEPEIRPPDFRIHLEDTSAFFVEVKNHHDPEKPLRLSSSYLSSLRRYADISKLPLRIAVYWSKGNLWTLVSSQHLPQRDGKFELSFEKALKTNEMADLGDLNVATTPPLTCRIITDPSKPRKVGPSGETPFTIGSVEFFCAGRQIEQNEERNLAFYFMLFGNWVEPEPQVHIEEEQLIYIDFTTNHPAPVPGREFQFIGTLSSMISRRFTALTAPEGQIQSVLASAEPGALGVVIPEEYKGTDLPLWRFVQQPNYG